MPAFRLAFRRIVRQPAFSLTVVCTLALAIAAGTTVFSYVNALLLRPFPFREPNQLVEIRAVAGGEAGKMSMREVLDLQERIPILESIAAHTGSAGGYNFSGDGKPMEWKAILTTGNLFDVLGLPLALGNRWILSADRNRDFKVILSYDIWQTAFGGRSDVVGKTITLDHAPGYEIAGVAPKGLDFPRGVEVFRSIGGFTDYEARTRRNVVAIARLLPGHTVAELDQQLEAFSARLATDFPDTNRGIAFRATTFRQIYSGDVRPYLIVLFGAVILLMLIACVNTANLLLARALANSRDLRVRLALGESRFSLMGQFVLESMLLALLAVLAGSAVAAWWMHLLRNLIGLELPSWMTVEIDGRVLLFTIAAALLTSLLSALGPAWHVTSTREFGASLRAGGRGMAGDRAANRMRTVLIAAQVALAVVLVCGAGLLIRALGEIQAAGNGFRAHGISTFRVALGWRRYGSREQITRYYEQAQQALAGSPGIIGVAFGSAPPLTRQEQEENNAIQLEGQSLFDAASNPMPHVQFISENYFEQLGIPLVAGRAFTPFDGDKSDTVAIVSQRLAERLWPGQSPIGQRIALNRTGASAPVYRTIIGVVANVRQQQLAEVAGLDLYLPYRQASASNQYLLVRTALDDSSFRSLAEKTLWAIDSEQSLFDFQTYERRILDGLWQLRLSRLVLILFGGAALLLAATGIFGLMSYVVSQRHRELGIRLALGAQAGRLRAEVVLQGFRIAILGLLAGTIGAWLAGSAIRGLLAAAKPFDWYSYGATVGIVLLSSVAASAWPAIRAARIDPIIALRED
jgi:putative ABC transport system permease protein